jgi:hypothetical protein
MIIMNKTLIDKSNNKKGRIILKNLTKKQKEEILSKGSAGVLGVLGGFGAFSLMSFSNNQDPMPIGSNATMIYAEDASSVEEFARIENTSEPVVIYTEAPFADGINNEMSFNEAFATAREEVGPGGIFEWRGETYGTYYKDEWDSLSNEEIEQYWDSVTEGTSSIQEETINISYEQETPPEVIEMENADGSYIITEEDFIEAIDTNDDGFVDVAVVDANNNDLPDIVIDTDYDGEMDVLVLDVNPETGELTTESEIIELTGDNPDLIVRDDNIDVYNDDTLNPGDNIDNDVDMSDYNS